MALKLSDRGLYEKKESENRITPVVLPTFEENEAIRKRLESIGLLQSNASTLIAEKNRTALSSGNENRKSGMYKQDATIGKSITDSRISDMQKQAEQQRMRSAVKAYTEREGSLPDIAPGQSVPTEDAPLPDIRKPEINKGIYGIGNYGAGFLSGVSSYAYGIENALADIGTGGKRGEEINRLSKYLSDNENERNTLFLSASYDEDAAVMKIAKSAGVSQETVRAYKKLEMPTFERQHLDEWANENNLNAAEKFLLGEAAFQIGQNIPNMVIMKALPIGEPKTIVDTAQKGIQAAYKAGNLNLKTAAKAIADGVVSAVKSLPHESLLMGNTFGNTFFENQKEYGDEKRILENFINSAGNAFVEGFTENLGGFTDIASVSGVLDSRTGSTAMTLVKTLMKAAFNMAEEGAEEVINVPLSGIVDKLTFEPDKKWFGDGGVFDTSEMIRSGVSGALVGGLMGAFGTVVAVADAVSPATKGVNGNVYSINAFADNMNPADIRAAAETLNRVSKNLGDGKTIDAKTATTEDIKARSAELLDMIRERAEMYKRGETDDAVTAQSNENAETNQNLYDKETERTGRENGASDDSIQTAKNISVAIGIPVRFYSAPGGEGIMENGYYKDGIIYVNAQSDTATAQILSHELTHAIGNTEEYSRLETMILRKMKEDGTYDTIMQRNQNLYADGKIYGRDAAQIRAEVTAEYVSKYLLTDEQSITSLVQENRSIGKKIRTFLDSILAKLGNKAAKERKFITDARNLYAKALGEKRISYSNEAQYSLKDIKPVYTSKGNVDDTDKTVSIPSEQTKATVSKSQDSDVRDDYLEFSPMFEEALKAETTQAYESEYTPAFEEAMRGTDQMDVQENSPEMERDISENERKTRINEKTNVKRDAAQEASFEEFDEQNALPEDDPGYIRDEALFENEHFKRVTRELPKNATDEEKEIYYNAYMVEGDKKKAFDQVKKIAQNRIMNAYGFKRDITSLVMDEIKREGGKTDANEEMKKELAEWDIDLEEDSRTEEEKKKNMREIYFRGDEGEIKEFEMLLAGGKTEQEALDILKKTFEVRRRDALNAKTAMRRLGYRISGAVSDNYFSAKGIIDAEHHADQISKKINNYIKKFSVTETVIDEAKNIAKGKYKIEQSHFDGYKLRQVEHLSRMYRDLEFFKKAGIKGTYANDKISIETDLKKIFNDFKWNSITNKKGKMLELNLTSPENVMYAFFGDTEVAKQLTERYITPVIDNSASARRQTNRQMARLMKHRLTRSESALTQIMAEYSLKDGEYEPTVSKEMLKRLMSGDENAVEDIIKAVSEYENKNTMDDIIASHNRQEAERVKREIKKLKEALERTKESIKKSDRDAFDRKRSEQRLPITDETGKPYYDEWMLSAKRRESVLEQAIREQEGALSVYESNAKHHEKLASDKRKKESVKRKDAENSKETEREGETYQSLRETLRQIAANAEMNRKRDKSYSVDHTIRKAEEAAIDFRELLNDMYDAINEVSVIHGRGEIKFRKNYMPHRQPDQARNAWEQLMKTAGFDEVTDLPASIAGKTAEFRPFRKWLSFAQRRKGVETVYDAIANMERYLYAANEAIYHVDDIMKLRIMEDYIRKQFEEAEQANREDILSNIEEEGEDDISIWEKEKQLKESSDAYGPLVTWLKHYTDDLAGKQIFSRDVENTIGRKVLRRASSIIRWSNRTMMSFNVASAMRNLSQLPHVIAETGHNSFVTPMYVFSANNQLEQRYRLSEKSTFLAEKTKMQQASYAYDRGTAKTHDTKNGKKKGEKTESEKGFGQDDSKLYVEIAEKAWEQTDIFMSKFAVYSYFEQGIENGMTEDEAIRYADKKARAILASRLRGATPLVFRSKNPIIQMITLFQRETLAQWENLVKTMPREWKRLSDQKGKKAASDAFVKYASSQIIAAWIANSVFQLLGLGTPAMFDVIDILFGNLVTGESGVFTGIIANLIKKYMRDFDNDEENDMTFYEAIKEGAKSDMKTVSKFIDDIPFGTSILAVFRSFGFDVDSRIPLNMPNISNIQKALSDIESIDMYGKMKTEETDPEILKQIEKAQNDEWAQLYYHAAQIAIDTIGVTATGGSQIRKTLNGALTVLQGGDYTDGYKQGQLKYTVADTDIPRAILFGKSGTISQQRWVNENFDTLTKKQTEAYQALTDSGVKPAKAYEIAKQMQDIRRNEDETLAEAQAAYIDSLWTLSKKQKAELYYSYVATEKQKEAVDAAVHAGGKLYDCVQVVRDIKEASRNYEKIDILLASNLREGSVRAIYETMVATKETDDNGNFIGYTDDEKVNAVLDAGMSYRDFLTIRSEHARLNADDSITAAQRSTRFLAWLSDMGYSEDRIMQIGDTFPFATGFTVDPKTYKKLIANGIDAKEAVEVTDALMGTKSTADKIAAIWDTTLTGKTLDTAIKTVITDGAYERYHTAIDSGVDVDVYLWVLNNADTNEDGYISNEERETAINHLMLGKGQASALWTATGGSDYSNPYDITSRRKSAFSVPSIGLGKIGLKKIGF